jgi:hypothetical protein
MIFSSNKETQNGDHRAACQKPEQRSASSAALDLLDISLMNAEIVRGFPLWIKKKARWDMRIPAGKWRRLENARQTRGGESLAPGHARKRV